MGKYHRQDFSGGWQPDADALNAPKNALLRATNLQFDDKGILSLRRGMAVQHTAIATYNSIYTIHSCYLTPTNLTTKERHLVRLVGCGDSVTGSPSDEGRVYWIDQSTAPQSLGVSFPISTVPQFSGAYAHDSFDIHFVDTMNRIFMTRGTVHKKWDGSTDDDTTWEDGDVANVTNWGLSMTGTKPTATARSSDTVTVDNFDDHTQWTTSPEGTVADDATNYIAGSSVSLTPDSSTNRGTMTRTYATVQDWQNWTGKIFEFVRKTVDNGSTYTDYTSEAGDGSGSTHVVLSSLNTLANGDGLIIGAQHTKFDTITVDMDASVNSNSATLAVAYYDADGNWTNVSNLSDGTASGGATFAQDGDITFDEPDDWIECAIDNVTAYFVRLTVSAQLDSSVQCDGITCGALNYVTPDTLFDFYAYVAEPKTTRSITVYIDTDDGDFDDNYFAFQFVKGETITTTLEPDEFFTQDFFDWWYEQYGREITEDEQSFLESREYARNAILRQMGQPTTQFVEFIPGANSGWNHLSLALGKFKKIGAPSWATVKALRFTIDADGVINFDEATLIGGESSSITGLYQYRYVYVSEQKDADGNVLYYTKSEPSKPSAPIQVKANSISVTIPADTSRDSQINEIWLYRSGGYLDQYYRVYRLRDDVVGTALTTSAYTIFDTLSDRRALILNDTMDFDVGPPPDDIVDLDGPYYSRIYALTQQFLYPSKIRQPENFADGEAIRVAEEGERAWWVKQAQGGLYVGTNKTIKRLDGTGAPLPDGTIDFILRDTNVRPAPVSSAVAQEGNLLFYLADDGWRSFNGVTSQPISGNTSLLYEGYTRHGYTIKAPGNLSSRYRAVIGRNALWALTPTSVFGSATDILRFDFSNGLWSQFSLPWQCQSIHREPDGDILVGTITGLTYKIDTGTQDQGSDISVTLWTPVDDNGQPDQRKDAYDHKIRIDTGAANATFAFHKDGAAAQTTSLTINANGLSTDHQSLSALGTFTQVQSRITGSFSTFKLYDYTLQYRERPEIREYYENRPESPHPCRRRFGGLTLLIDTLNANATVTPVLDDSDQSSQTVSCNDSQIKKIPITSDIGRDLWCRIEKTTGFEVYDVQPIVIEEFPEQVKGLLPKSNFGYDGQKVMSGISIRACTLNSQVTFTVYLDGNAYGTTWNLTTGADEPVTDFFNFTSAQTATDIALSTNGLVELYKWEPQILYTLPLPRILWDTGPIDLGFDEIFWIREIKVKAKTTANLTVTPYFDDTAFSSYTATAVSGKTTVYHVPVGREYKGKVPRVLVQTSNNSEFNPYWIEFLFRGSGNKFQKKNFRVKP